MGNRTIYALSDYKGNFGSKADSIPYNSGMDKNLLQKYFLTFGFEVVFIPFSEVINYSNNFWENNLVIYTSSEDIGYYYKSYIEDIIYYLELSNAKLIPPFKYLKANNNKIFMELLRQQFSTEVCNIKSKVFGCYEEVEKMSNNLSFPLVYKQSAGAMSKGVGLIASMDELEHKLKKVSRTSNLLKELWEYGRSIKYKGYIRESKYRNKFIIQDYLAGLDGDYKVLVFSNKYYILKRNTRKDDFRASGSGIRNFVKEFPRGLLEFANLCKNTLKVPQVSLDIAYNGKSFFLIEFQCLYFGSYTITYSEFYWCKTEENGFVLTQGKSVLEAEFARSVAEFCFQD